MKKQSIWIAVLLLGFVPFLFPIFSGLYRMTIESWSLFDWVVMYSFIYWPTYIIGIFAIPIAIFHLLKQRI